MKKTIKLMIAGLLVAPALAFSVGAAQPASALLNGGINEGLNAAANANTATCLFTSTTCTNGIFTTVINVLLYVIGAISVIMLIYGGVRYTISAGDPGAVTAAKNTILYAIVGIVVALLAYAIVNFVITSLMV